MIKVGKLQHIICFTLPWALIVIILMTVEAVNSCFP